MNDHSPSTHPTSTHLKVGQAIFTEDYLLKAARVSGFHKRAPRKISACDLLSTVCAKCVDGSPSCNDLAASLDSSTPEDGPSRQAVCLRMNESFADFIHRILEDVVPRHEPAWIKSQIPAGGSDDYSPDRAGSFSSGREISGWT